MSINKVTDNQRSHQTSSSGLHEYAHKHTHIHTHSTLICTHEPNEQISIRVGMSRNYKRCSWRMTWAKMQNHEVNVLTRLWKHNCVVPAPTYPANHLFPHEDALSISESQGGYIQTHPAQMWRSAGHTSCEPTLLNSATIIAYFSTFRTLVTK